MIPEGRMSTRTPQAPAKKPADSSTEFQLHKSQSRAPSDLTNLVDYTEFRLELYISQIVDQQQRLTLEDILASYREGTVSVAWKAGKPVWIKVKKS